MPRTASKKTTKRKSTAKRAVKKASAKTAGKSSKRAQKTAKPAAKKSAGSVSSAGKNLVIVESPAKARTLSGYLGSGYVVKASVGHILDLPRKRLGVKIQDNFEPEYEVIDGKEEIINALKKSAESTKEIFIATDPDREGEAIAYHIAGELKNGGKSARRVLFNEITRDAVRKALERPGEIDQTKVDAQQARRVLDRLVGYLVSPLLQRIIARGVSAGRVQSVALRLICEREEEINAFQSVEYWSITADLAANKKQIFQAKLVRIDGKKAQVDNEKQANSIVGDLKNKPFTLTSLKNRTTTSKPSAPYTTSTLQQDAARRLRYSNSRTMSLAQQLYEGIEIGSEGLTGLITYMRTDSVRIAPEAVTDTREYIAERFGKDFLPSRARIYKTKKSAQDAHEAIRPTSVARDPASLKKYLKPDQYKLYELIWKRFVASQMADAEFFVTTALLEVGKYEFSASGRRMVFAGHLQALAELEAEQNGNGNDAEQSQELPELEKGRDYPAKKITPKQHFTQPPPRYNAGSLVKELDERGIGRPSTYAQIVSVLIKRRYVETKERRFHPTDLGIAVNRVLVDQFPDIFNVNFTARMEEELDAVENAREDWRKVVDHFYRPFSKDLEKVKENRSEIKKKAEEDVGKPCPECGSKMVIKWGRNGRFIACTGFPDCKYTEPLNGEEPPEVPETACPTCGMPMSPKRSRFGWFLGCTGYPKCRTTLPIDSKEDIMPCPKEGCKGKILPRRSKRGKVFYGCSKYPECDFVSWHKPVPETCPQCGNPYMEDKNLKSGHIHQCPKCKHKVPVESE